MEFTSNFDDILTIIDTYKNEHGASIIKSKPIYEYWKKRLGETVDNEWLETVASEITILWSLCWSTHYWNQYENVKLLCEAFKLHQQDSMVWAAYLMNNDDTKLYTAYISKINDEPPNDINVKIEVLLCNTETTWDTYEILSPSQSIFEKNMCITKDDESLKKLQLIIPDDLLEATDGILCSTWNFSWGLVFLSSLYYDSGTKIKRHGVNVLNYGLFEEFALKIYEFHKRSDYIK